MDDSASRCIEEVEGEDYDAEEIRHFMEGQVAERIARYLDRQEQRGRGACESLMDAFGDLRKEAVIALHFAGDTQSDALAAIDEARRTSHQDGVGFAFFTIQDAELAVQSDLRIGLGAFQPQDAPEIAQRIVSALRSRGLDAHWCGDVSMRIKVAIDWQWPRCKEFPYLGRDLDPQAAPWLYAPE